ncbi:alkaline phosphatase [Clostridium sp.]|uniref:alkaline phosphatase n=1 Tax=Clostridium sp. TaxID=1506 RepID=UPI003F3F4A03
MNKKLKYIIAAAIVTAMTTTSVFSTRNVVEVKADEKGNTKNVIFMIADGMSTEAITLARYYNGGTLTMDEISSGAVTTRWANGPITDSAPGGTAYSAGQKTLNKYIATSTEEKPLATLIEGAEAIGKSTGIIATSEITHATPADFSAHTDNRANYNHILKQQINNDMEVVLGGGFGVASQYKDVQDFNKYKEERIEEIKSEGFDYVTSKEEMDNYNGEKLWGSFSNADVKYNLDRIESNDSTEASLEDMTNKAIEVLNKNQDGFFLMVEGSKIDWAAHNNEPVGMASDIVAFDNAVKAAVDFAKKDGNTIVIVTTDHGNSGITIGSKEFNENVTSYDKATFEQTVNNIKDAKITEESFMNLIKGKSDSEISSLTKKYYGYDNLTAEELNLIKDSSKGIKSVIATRCGLGFTTTGHTGEDVYLGVYAPQNMEKLSGVVDNTEVNRYVEEHFLGSGALESHTNNIFLDGETTLNSIEGVTVDLNIENGDAPKVLVEKGGNKVELELFTNNYKLNGEEKELKTVMPYIKGKYYIPQELVDIIKNLEDKPGSQYNHYYGDFHNHTGYSDGKYGSTPRDAYQFAYDQGDVDFMAITDHSSMINDNEWTDTVATANELNEDGRFVAIAGYEQTQLFGHMNVFSLNEEDKPINDWNMDRWYTTLSQMPYSLAQFNHPDGTDYGDFKDFKYVEELDSIVNLFEIGCGDSSIEESDYYFRWSRFDGYYQQYFNALDQGWHLAPVNNQDNHRGSWYALNECRGVVLSDNLSREGIYDAVRNRRLYATEDENQKINFTINGEVMGSILENSEEFKGNVSISDPNSDDLISKVEILGDGGKFVDGRFEINSNSFDWDFNINNAAGNRYFVVKVTKADGGISITAPIWTGLEFDNSEEEVEKEVGMTISKSEIEDINDTFEISLNNLRKPSVGSDWVGIYEKDTEPGKRNSIWWNWLNDLGVDEAGNSKFTVDLNQSIESEKHRLQAGKDYKAVVFYGGSYDAKAEVNFSIKQNSNDIVVETEVGGSN